MYINCIFLIRMSENKKTIVSTHHPMTPQSDMRLKNIKVTINGLLNNSGKWNEHQHASK